MIRENNPRNASERGLQITGLWIAAQRETSIYDVTGVEHIVFFSPVLKHDKHHYLFVAVNYYTSCLCFSTLALALEFCFTRAWISACLACCWTQIEHNIYFILELNVLCSLVVTFLSEHELHRPVSNVALLPCQTKLIELNSTLARQ